MQPPYQGKPDPSLDVVSEVDPDGKEADAPGAKLDGNKPDLSLLLDFSRSLCAIGQVATDGAKKYSRGGWLLVPDGINRYRAAKMRHMFHGALSDYDAGSGSLHIAHEAWNALAVLELTLREMENDE